MGCYKVNINGAVFSKRKQVGVGVVIRDEVGQLIAALCQKLYTPLGPLEIEAFWGQVRDRGRSSGCDFWERLDSAHQCYSRTEWSCLICSKCRQRYTPKCLRFLDLWFFAHKKTRKCYGPHIGPTCNERKGLPSLAWRVPEWYYACMHAGCMCFIHLWMKIEYFP